MLNSKQRSNLRSLAQKIEPITQLGKGGINDAFIEGLDKAIEKRELIKVTVLDNAEDTPRDIAENIAELLEAVPVAVIGRKAIFYRYSRRDKYAHLEF